MSRVLPAFAREDFLPRFSRPVSWSRVVQDHEFMRGWRVLHETRRAVLVGHGSGAVVRLARQGDEVSAPEVIEGDAARALFGRHGMAPGEGTRRRAASVLARGRDATEALGQYMRHYTRRLLAGQDAPANRLRLNHGWDGVLEVTVRPDGTIASHGWITGLRAIELIEAGEGAAG